MRHRLPIGILIGVLLGGCGTHGIIAAFNAPRERAATMTVIRPSALGLGDRQEVCIDGERALGLRVGEHATIVVPAGRRYVGLQRGYRLWEIEVDVKPGSHTYVVIEPGMLSNSLAVVPVARGYELVRETSRIEQ